MRTLLFSTLAATFIALTACGGGEPAATGGAHAADAPAAAAAATPAADEPVICCEFGGATGTSTKTLCDEYKGVVVADDKCKK